MHAKLRAYVSVQLLQQVSDVLANSILTIYLLKKGINYTQISLLWIFFLGMTFIFEYPSGGLADRFGRRTIYIVGVIATIISYVLVLHNNFIWICISYSIKGFGAALISGTLNAWLSHETKDNNTFKSVLGQAKIVETIGIILMSVMMIYLNLKNLDIYIYIVIAIEILILIVATIFMPDNYGSKEKIGQINRMAIKELLQSKELKYSVLLSCLIYMYFTTFNLVWQPIAILCSIDSNYFTAINAISILMAGISSFAYSKRNRVSYKNDIIGLIFAYCTSFALFILSMETSFTIILIFSMLFFGIGKGTSFILLSTWINQNSKAEYKASTFSLISAFSSVVNLAIQFLYGRIADLFSLSYVLIINIILSIIAVVILIYIIKINKVKSLELGGDIK